MKKPPQHGQGVVEYALILALIAIGTILAFQLTGVSLGDVFCRVSNGIKPGSCGSGVLCSDDFANLGSSQNVSGGWNNTNGQACINGTGVLYNSCSMTNLKTNDYTASLDGATLTNGNGYGIYFRATMTPAGINGYAFQFDPGASGFVIRKWTNGREIYPTLAYKSMPGYDWRGEAHKLEIKVSGSTFTGYVDGVAMLTATDNTYSSGGTGIRTWDSTNVCIDGFSLKPPTP
jgi:Flp pilus assembly pilin Flp